MVPQHTSATSAIFITFAGNCKEALKVYQSCFGGHLQFETFEKRLPGIKQQPVVRGSLVSDCIVILGSDLVHNEGRRPGNHMSIFFKCTDANIRRSLIQKLKSDK